MRKAILFGTLAAIAAISVACGGPAANTNTNTNVANGNAAPGNNGTLTPKAQTPQPVTNNAPTFTPILKTYCEAINKGDEATLRKIYSADTLKNFAEQMKSQNVKTLKEFLEDDKAGETCEATNEQINGDQATVRFKTKAYPTGVTLLFVKEGGEWKLTNKSPDITNMKPSTSSNTAK